VRRTCAAVLGAVTIVAALGLSGCSDDTSSTPVPLTKPPTDAASPTETGAPVPPPTALTDVMSRLADPNVPGTDKVALVQYSTPADAAALDRFGTALADGGYMPLTFDAQDLTWAQDEQGNIIANIIIKTSNPQAGGRDLKFPMEFSPQQDTWQLTRKTADLLLQLGKQPTATTTP